MIREREGRGLRLYQSQEELKLENERFWKGRKIEKQDLEGEGNRPLTFGSIKKCEPLRNSTE